MNPSNFKVGDRVLVQGKIPGTTLSYDTPKRGEIIKHDGPKSIQVKIFKEDGTTFHDQWWFYDENLTIDWQAAMISNTNAQLSPQSPQPQQPQQKEDTVMYAVVFYSHTTGTGSIHSYHVTEAEAKQKAEVLVAAQRSNLQQKQYFTVTILNLREGMLVGSVVDAPPAVDWAS